MIEGRPGNDIRRTSVMCQAYLMSSACKYSLIKNIECLRLLRNQRSFFWMLLHTRQKNDHDQV